jgi:RNA polymerase sigma factor (sigma-70 family)
MSGIPESFYLFPVVQNMPLSDEGNLWIQARNGDRKAFARLFDLHASALYRFASRLLGPGPDAEDVVQDVLLSVLQHDKFDPSRGSHRSYLFGAVRNQALKRQRVVLEELSPFVPSREAAPDQEMARSHLIFSKAVNPPAAFASIPSHSAVKVEEPFVLGTSQTGFYTCFIISRTGVNLPECEPPPERARVRISQTGVTKGQFVAHVYRPVARLTRHLKISEIGLGDWYAESQAQRPTDELRTQR